MEIYSFLVRKINNDNEEAVNLAKALMPFGIQVKFEDAVFMDDDNFSKLTIVFDEDELKQRRTRNAGIKVKYNEDAYYETVGTVKEHLKSQTQEEVASYLGMSRMTLYRKLKMAEKMNVSDDYPIYMI